MNYVCERSILRLRPPAGGIFANYAGLQGNFEMRSVVLDRHKRFQTELFVLSSGCDRVEMHCHPGVDSIELGVAGLFEFSLGDKGYPLITNGQRIGDNIPVPVGEFALHGAVISGGASFLSFQYWKDKEPTTVGDSFKTLREEK